MTVQRTHEQIFHFTKEPRYFAAVDEVREPQTGPVFTGKGGVNQDDWVPNTQAWRAGGKGMKMGDREYNPLGKLPGSVWNLTWAQVVERIVKGWCPGGICTECGEGRRPVVDVSYVPNRSRWGGAKLEHDRYTAGLESQGFSGQGRPGSAHSRLGSVEKNATITGYTCACPEPTAPTRDPVILVLER